MKAFGLLVLAFLLMSMVSDAVSQVRVRGYTRKNGTYVAPHYRSSPNSSKYDNYSSKGNYNPYTGGKGTAETIPSTTTYRPHVSYPATSSYAPSYRDRTYRPAYSTQPQGTYSSPQPLGQGDSQSNNAQRIAEPQRPRGTGSSLSWASLSQNRSDTASCQSPELARAELEIAASELLSCARRRDYSDDCARAKRDASDAGNAYEEAIATTDSGCE